MLDGVASTEERIVFMTTNHVERLDPALISSVYLFRDISFQRTILNIIILLFKDREELIWKCKCTTPAQLRWRECFCGFTRTRYDDESDQLPPLEPLCDCVCVCVLKVICLRVILSCLLVGFFRGYRLFICVATIYHTGRAGGQICARRGGERAAVEHGPLAGLLHVPQRGPTCGHHQHASIVWAVGREKERERARYATSPDHPQ